MRLQALFISLVLVLASVAEYAWAQQEPKVYQLSGLVLNRSTNEPIPYAVIQINHSRRRAICNQNGFFSIPVIATDTLNFFSLAYFSNKIVMQDFLSAYEGDTISYLLYVTHLMIEDDIDLPEIHIRPYETPEEVRLALINMPLDENSPAAIAARNVSPEVLAYMVENLPLDDAERRGAAGKQYYLRYVYQNRLATVGVDPFAVYQLVNYFSQKSKQKKKKTYDYWPDQE
jgi:hypothetical protein